MAIRAPNFILLKDTWLPLASIQFARVAGDHAVELL